MCKYSCLCACVSCLINFRVQSRQICTKKWSAAKALCFGQPNYVNKAQIPHFVQLFAAVDMLLSEQRDQLAKPLSAPPTPVDCTSNAAEHSSYAPLAGELGPNDRPVKTRKRFLSLNAPRILVCSLLKTHDSILYIMRKIEACEPGRSPCHDAARLPTGRSTDHMLPYSIHQGADVHSWGPSPYSPARPLLPTRGSPDFESKKMGMQHAYYTTNTYTYHHGNTRIWPLQPTGRQTSSP